MMDKRVHLLIRGRVQGVAFRDFTERRALALGLNGWVRNLPDGSVEALAEGPEGDLRALLESVRMGPPAARVDAVREEWSEAAGDLRRFSIVF